MNQPIRVGLVGIGNCASTLVQGLAAHRATGQLPGVLHPKLGSYTLDDIEVVLAIDIDARKVGQDLADAIHAAPNNAARLDIDVPNQDVTVAMGPILDGRPLHLSQLVTPATLPPIDVTEQLHETGTDVLVNMVPTGSADAAKYYAQAALDAGVAFINGMPATIACDPGYAAHAAAKGVPVIGDDVKSQFGATIAHRTILAAMAARGIELYRTHQLNYAGNTDFKNLIARGSTKEQTKTSALTTLVDTPLEVSTGFAYLPSCRDRKTAEILVEGANFGGTPVTVRLTVEVEDSANFGGVIVDAIRACQIARDRGIGGTLDAASALLMKNPPQPMTDDEATRAFAAFVADTQCR
jgi:myo-inositol-1-phosphate synthase